MGGEAGRAPSGGLRSYVCSRTGWGRHHHHDGINATKMATKIMVFIFILMNIIILIMMEGIMTIMNNRGMMAITMIINNIIYYIYVLF